ncbi:mediator complex subunit Med5 [Coniochaeta sp. 2T2.1]|nr:mediator complex subunit Med5 [Coniochaeta sp. 2T2.1]
MNAHGAHGTDALQQWRHFLSQCFLKRLDPAKFDSLVPVHQSRSPLSPILVADILLRPDARNSYAPDPLATPFLDVLLRRRSVTPAAVLFALARYSSLRQPQARQDEEEHADGGADGKKASSEKPSMRWANSFVVEQVIFMRLAKAVKDEDAVKNMKDAVDVIKILVQWMALFTDMAAAFAEDVMGAVHGNNVKIEVECSRSAFVLLLSTICENPAVLSALSGMSAQGGRKQLSDGLAKFISTLQPTEITPQLEMFRTQTLPSLEPVDKQKEAAEAQVYEVFDQTVGLDSFQVRELPVENTRAGLYIYLNAALVGRPLIEDTALFTYLHNRYQGDLQTTAVHLILASFDVLANAVFRNEGVKSGPLLRSYLVNKVPLVLASFAANTNSIYPFNSEFCISQALSQVDMNVFPNVSDMFDISSAHNTFTENVRQDFFYACLLHGLVSESSREKILGDITFQSLPGGGRYQKDVLVQECLQNPERMKELIGEIDAMEGNAGAVCQALAEVLVQLCHNKETMSLKQWCGQLARKPQSLDILLLFNKPELIFRPLCELLDNWTHDEDREDQGEYQLVYEEFSSVLLIFQALVYRYGLSAADLKIHSPASFVGKLLSKTHHARHLDDLSEQERGQIGGWVHGLFDADVSGLGDELMSSCSPQDFYLLIPTLLHQIVLAFSAGVLTEDMLKGGLEYLVEPFLLPSLIPAILYLCAHLWADQRDQQKAVIRILQLIILPNSIANEEASRMLSTVLTIVAVPLENALRSYLKQDPNNQDIDPLLRALRENIPLSRRMGAADHNEIETWCSTSGGNLTAMVRHIMQSLTQWCQTHANLNGIPPSYTHRQMIVATKMVGAKCLLTTILEELKQQTEAGNGSIAYDVATALVCAPDVTDETTLLQAPPMVALLDESGQVPAQLQRRVSLRTALKHHAENWNKIRNSDPSMAEIVVRLYRRVEAQMALPPEPQQMVVMDGVSNLVGLDGVAGSMNDAIAAAAAAAAVDAAGGGEGLMVDTSVGDMGMGGTGGGGGDLGGLASAADSAGGMGALDEDMFGSLGDAGSFNDMNWGDLDLS